MTPIVYILATTGILAAGAVVEWVADTIMPGLGVWLARAGDES